MADYEEIFMELGINIPPEMLGSSQTDSSWHQRLRRVMNEAEKGTWVAVAEGSLTHMRVYRSTFRKGDMNIPGGAVFECQVLRIPEQDHRGRLAFRYRGQWDDPEIAGEVHRHENNQRVWYLMDYDKYVPRQRKEDREPWLLLDRAGILAWLQTESDNGTTDDELAEILNKWEQEHNWTELEEHAAAAARLGDALGDLAENKEAPPVAPLAAVGEENQPNAGEAPQTPVPSDGSGGADTGSVDQSGGTVPAVEADPVPVAGPLCPSQQSPNGDHEWWSPLQGAPPVCRWCDIEQPNTAEVQQVVQPPPVPVVADPSFPNLHEQLANRSQTPAPEEPIPGLEDMS